MRANVPNGTTTSTIREAVVADAFYPGDSRRLSQAVDGYLEEGQGEARGFPKAIIAPHAGYIYSGPIAGSAFKSWRNQGKTVKRVVLIGPSHYVAFDGLALSHHLVWTTPLGQVTVDMEAVEQIRHLSQVHFLDEAHTREHCLEVELAFLQRIFDQFMIVPIVTGEVTDDRVAEIMVRLWGGKETVFVISSDLSHYLDYATACRLDRTTAEAIQMMQPDAIHPNQACGRLAIQGLLQVAEHMKLQAETVDLRNSGDTAGRKDRVVGYGAFVFGSSPPEKKDN